MMNSLYEQLSQRKDVCGLRTIEPTVFGELPLLLLTIDSPRKVTVLLTHGLSNYRMPVSEAYTGFEFNEICFCLPSYWDLDDPTNVRCSWVFSWIQRLAKFAQDNQTFFGHGHTIATGNPPQPLSETMKHTHFLFAHPDLLSDVLTPIQLEDKTVHFLCIVPLLTDEFEYKHGRNTAKFLKKFRAKNFTEVLDDFRESAVRRKYFLF